MTRTLTPLLAALMLATAPMTYAASQANSRMAPKSSVARKGGLSHQRLHGCPRRHAQHRKPPQCQPGVKIVVVTHGKGIDFLLNNAQDEKGAYEPQVAGLKNRGVTFDVCRNTLKGRNLDDSAVIMEAQVVPSGVAEIGKLQAKEGYVYIKP